MLRVLSEKVSLNETKGKFIASSGCCRLIAAMLVDLHGIASGMTGAAFLRREAAT